MSRQEHQAEQTRDGLGVAGPVERGRPPATSGPVRRLSGASLRSQGRRLGRCARATDRERHSKAREQKRERRRRDDSEAAQVRASTRRAGDTGPLQLGTGERRATRLGTEQTCTAFRGCHAPGSEAEPNTHTPPPRRRPPPASQLLTSSPSSPRRPVGRLRRRVKAWGPGRTGRPWRWSRGARPGRPGGAPARRATAGRAGAASLRRWAVRGAGARRASGSALPRGSGDGVQRERGRTPSSTGTEKKASSCPTAFWISASSLT